jgi:hypothetical protein
MEKSVEKNDDPLLWEIGKIDVRGSVTRGYVFFNDDYNEVLATSNKIKKRYSKHFIIWFGSTSATTAISPKIISFWDILIIKNDCIELSQEMLFDTLVQTKVINADFKLLDTHIALEKDGTKWFLNFQRNRQTFKYRDSIKPQAARLIEHCFQIRSYEKNAKTLEEFTASGLALNKSTISTRRKEVNDLCKKRHQKDIFLKFENEKWGFNPNLTP